MAIETETVGKITQRGNDLAVETAHTLVDAAYTVPRQVFELNQAVLQNLAAHHQTNRDLAGTLVRQTMEAQTLWWRFFQTSLQIGFDTFTRAAETTEASLRDQERRVAGPATATDKRAIVTAK